jgi:hypothetical protein
MGEIREERGLRQVAMVKEEPPVVSWRKLAGWEEVREAESALSGVGDSDRREPDGEEAQPVKQGLPGKGDFSYVPVLPFPKAAVQPAKAEPPGKYSKSYVPVAPFPKAEAQLVRQLEEAASLLGGRKGSSDIEVPLFSKPESPASPVSSRFDWTQDLVPTLTAVGMLIAMALGIWLVVLALDHLEP